MEQRVKTLEDLCELITREVVEQNKNMMEVNKNLLNEIRNLRESFVKQDDDFEEFKTLLRKLCELNRQNGGGPMSASLGNFPFPPSMFAQPPPPPLNPANSTITSQQQSQAGAMNNSYLVDLINQSMMNNLSFQSERTPFNASNLPPTFSNLNITNSVPSSASALSQQTKQQQQNLNQQQVQQQQQQQQILLKQQQQHQQQQKPSFMQPVPPNLTQQPPPPAPPSTSILNFNKMPPTQQVATMNNEANIKFTPPTNTTSTPQPFGISKLLNNNAASANVNNQPSSNNKPPLFELSPSKPLVDSANKEQAQKTSIFGSNPLFGGQKTTSIFGAPPPSFNNPPPMNLFKAPEPTTLEDNDDETIGGGNPEEYEPQVDFKPIVQLKEVEVKTGEEDELVLYVQRCKLYRFVSETKEWKEKGLGDIKLLKHKQTNVVRLLMRREQVLKLCANHRITPDLKPTEVSDKQISWVASDFSELVSKNEIFLAKFRNAEEASKFKNEFEKAVIAAKSLPSTTPTKQPVNAANAVSKGPSLSEQFKTDKWSCTGCYTLNKKEDLKCVCCQTAKPGTESAATSSTLKFPTSTTMPSISSTSNQNQPVKSSQSTFSFSPLPSTAAPTIATTIAITTPTKPLFTFGTQPQAAQTTTAQKFDFGSKEFNVNSKSPATQTLNGPLTFGKMPAFGNPSNSNQSSNNSLFGTPSLAVFGNSPQTTSKPLFGASPSIANSQQDDEGGEENENPEEYEPKVDFKPLVKLDEVDVKTGEEDEDIMFKKHCKVFRFDSVSKQWKEKGTGELKILRHKENQSMYRILMRRDQVLKLCLNHRITSDLNFEAFENKQIRWHAQDYSEGQSGKHETLACRFKNEDDAASFKSVCDIAQRILINLEPNENKVKVTVPKETTQEKPSLSQMFNNKAKWTCDGCYVQNEPENVKCAACQAPGPSANAPSATTLAKPNELNNKISFGASNNTSNISFGLPATIQPAAKPILFNTSALNVDQSITSSKETVTIDSVFGAKAGLSFADLAKSSQPMGFSGGFKAIGTASTPLFGSNPSTKPAMLFGSAATTTSPATNATTEDGDEGGDNQNPEEYEPQVDFKPLVKLHEVDVKTGEEDEDVLFKQRCKLYRFDNNTKEWKEKGAGEIKILKHKQKENSYRIIMRRDQVLKICANHRIAADLKLELVNEKQIRYLANDCSEGEPHTEYLTARFRHEEDAKKFKSEVERIQIEMSKFVGSSGPAVTNQTNKNVTTSNVNKNNGLASLIKEGSWNCTSCLSTNKADYNKCAACEEPKLTNPSDFKNDDDIEVTFSLRATKDQVEQAKKLQLPDNFYLYLNKPTCAGCRGCENDEQ